MLKSRSLLRWLARSTVLCLALAVAFCFGTFASARSYQRRVHILYGRVKSLSAGASTFQDAQELANDYRSSVVFEHGVCAPEKCGFTVRLDNLSFPVFYDAPILWRLGIRPTYAEATLRVNSGRLRYADFGLATRTQYGDWLETSFHAVPALSMYDKCSEDYLGRDSTYALDGGHLTNGDGGGWIRRTSFGSKASTDERRRATTLNLSCITAIPSCKNLDDLIPEAVKGVSFKPIRDESFNKECEDYVKNVEVGPGPWSVDSAFDADPVSVSIWTISRSGREPDSP